MSKKHFIALARVMMSQMPEFPSKQCAAMSQWESDKNALADFCQSQNPRFNRELWLAYIAGECGPGGGKR